MEVFAVPDIRHFNLNKTCRWLLVHIAIVLSGLSAAAPPEMSAHSTTASQLANAAAPIAPLDIAARANEEQQLIDRARQLLDQPDTVATLRSSLDDIAHTVDAKMGITTGVALRDLPVMRLESLAKHWEFDARRFERWEFQSRQALDPFAATAIQLSQHRTAWSTTRAEGMLDGLPPMMTERIDSILSQIDSVESALEDALGRQFALTRRASELKARIQAGRKNVDTAIDDIDRRLLAIDTLPIWMGIGGNADTKEALSAMNYGFEIEKQFALDYHAAQTGNQQSLRLVQFLLLPLILWLFLRSKRSPGQDVATDKVARAMRRPISIWVLLSMLAVLILEPDAPLLVQECALLLTIIPALRLLPPGTIRALGAWPYLATGLYALDRLCVAAVTDSGWYRLLLLVLNLLALGFTFWLSRKPLASVSPGYRKLRNAVRNAGWIALVILVVAAVSNVVGNVSLAETLTSGVIDSGYMALLLYSGVNACLAIGRALLLQPELADRGFLRRHMVVLQQICARLLLVGAVLGWLLYTGDRFRLLRPLYHVGGMIMALGVNIGEVSIHLGDVVVFAFASWLALRVAKGVRSLLHDELPNHAALPRGVGNSITSLSYYGVLILGLAIALAAAGFRLSQMAIVFGALGVGIGFGLQNVVNNFVSGLVLMFERPIQPGDLVDTAGASGTVSEIRLRSTTIRTFDGADVVVPNGLLLSGNLTNWTMHDQYRRIEVTVGVEYSAKPEEVLLLLDAAARETPGVAAQPGPVVLMTGFGEIALMFSIRVWTDDINDWPSIRSDLYARTLATLQNAGISIPYKEVNISLRTEFEQPSTQD
ncbi:mechanosensitive ion channel protein MscS [Janthinobacterium svalbardensis]|uniref:Mechanosensitive ion channel protein MscS n=1 Tax=Janthinobacterium svalbardensis TaxID=368607 RepID=A0A290WZC4_9BURK|nr:mechanosensitive ion channel domain-containing protein [Janthinobacterium svalbardensis]ATD62231.1 mechanosensitive ion channel protein MscS [Janthinobacterium svalbardensis]